MRQQTMKYLRTKPLYCVHVCFDASKWSHQLSSVN